MCQHGGRTLSTEITREFFDKLSEDLLRLTEDEVDRALAEVNLDTSAVGVALLVGGSSKMPMVHTMMRRKASVLRMSKDPDHCVALGAALEAARQSTGEGLYKPAFRRFLENTTITDRTPHGLGLIAAEGGALVNAIVIPKNTEIPCEKSRDDITTNVDGQTTLSVHLVQGEDSDALACVPVATYEFAGIAKRKAGESVVRITYRYNENNVVEVSALDVKSQTALTQKTLALVDLLELRRGMEGSKVRMVRPRQVALLIDSSGSMVLRMDQAKDACLKFIENTDFESVEIGLIQFGMGIGASVLHGLSRDAKSLRNKVATLVASGGTPMHEALSLGVAMLGGTDKNIEKFIVLFTDGYPDDRARTTNSCAGAKRLGIQVMCIGVGSADQELLDEMATTPGNVEFSRSSEELVTSFGNIARLISGRRV